MKIYFQSHHLVVQRSGLIRHFFSRLSQLGAIVTLATFGVAFFNQASYADSTLLNKSIGGLLGASFISSTTQFTYGLEGTYELCPPWGLGLSLTHYNTGSSAPGISGVTSYSSSFTTLTAQGLYFLTQYVPGLRVGGQLGLGISSTDIPNASGSTNLILGPMVGYDHPILPQLSVGAESTLYFNTASNSSALLQLLGVVKYWF